MKFRPLHSASDLSSPFNRGTGFAIAVGAAAVLFCAGLSFAYLALKLIGM